MPTPGRPPLLDEPTQQTLCALIAVGVSRRQAAMHVGLSPSAIAKRCERDPAFDQRVRAAEVQRKVRALESLGQHSQRSWRAAVWILENTCPEFAKKPRRDPEAVEDLIDRLLETTCEVVHDRRLQAEILERVVKMVAVEFPDQLSPAARGEYQYCIRNQQHALPPPVAQVDDDDDALGYLDDDDNELDDADELNDADADEPGDLPEEEDDPAADSDCDEESGAGDELNDQVDELDADHRKPVDFQPANLAPETNRVSQPNPRVEAPVNLPLPHFSPRSPSPAGCHEEIRELLIPSTNVPIHPRHAGGGGNLVHLLE